MGKLLKDVQYALRQFRRNPGSFVAIPASPSPQR
jgi:hypothetical protein